MENVTTVVLALEASEVAEEVMHFLDRSGCARVVATAADDRQAAEAVRQLDPEAVVAQPSLVSAGTLRGRPLLALETRESVVALRSAIRAGASGFFVWPGDREALAAAVAASGARPVSANPLAVIVAVHAARGGAGATFVATHLAAGLARKGSSCVLIDADVLYGDVATALGAPSEGVHTLGDLLPLAEELTIEQLDDALWRHDAGFGVVLAPPPEDAAGVRADGVRAVVHVAAAAAEAVVVHLPRELSGPGMAGLQAADRILEVLSLDVMSFRAATRAIEAMKPLELPGRIGFVVNRAARAEIVPADVARVFGTQALAVVPFERSVPRLQDHGRLLGPRGRTARTFDRLATRVLEPVLDEEAS